MAKRPIAFEGPGRFEIYCHHSAPTHYPEESHETVQVCIPLERARYAVIRQSETGRKLVHDLGSRDVLVLPARQPHAVDWQRPADIVSLQLSSSFIRAALGDSELRLQDAFTLRNPFLSAVAGQIRSAGQSERGITPAFAEAMATAIAYRIGMEASVDTGMRAPRAVYKLSEVQLRRIKCFIEDQLDQPLRLAELAEQVGLTKWHFIRRFGATYGVSPRDFITDRRIARARELLSSTGMPIIDVALEVGMTHSHFSRTFLSRVGVSPSEYRLQAAK